ncbi:periplasmic [NiFe] hydrogenase large subunit precursor [bacterium BMS3Abin01]|nr:periplasmic [NiFe] hydrogenase large subunit precursor [bacterium BMS3Abin01]
MARVVVDPMTRLEGHLRIEVEVDNGVVKDAWATTTLFRGFEIFIKDRDPRDVWHIAQRICGVCPTSHGICATQGLEESFGVTPPDNAVLVRNLMEVAQYLHSHVLWFYGLNAFDYVDVISGLSAKANTPALKAVQERLQAFVDSGQLGFLANGYWGHPGMLLTPEQNLELSAHYLQALDIQAKAARALAVFGGKFPHHMSTPPGGVTAIPTLQDIVNYETIMKEVSDFVINVMVPDTLAAGAAYIDLTKIGAGVGNFFTWGVLEDVKSRDPYKRSLPRGAIFGGKLAVEKVSPADAMEYVKHSWYTPESGEGKNPGDVDATTQPEFTSMPDKVGPDDKYTWTKTTQIKNKQMEVGTLARMLVAYLSKAPGATKIVDDALAALGAAGKPEILVSALGRLATKPLEAALIVQKMEADMAMLKENIVAGKGEWFIPNDVPKSGQGVGAWDAPRGSLAHFNHIEDSKISNYQATPASNWNFSARDDKGTRGPCEEALVGTPVADPEKPLEILRVVHTFDP